MTPERGIDMPRELSDAELLRTPRLLLRRWTPQDAVAFLEIYSRWDVMRWLGAPPRRVVADLAEARDRLQRWHDREIGLAAPLGLWALVVDGSQTVAPVGTVLLLPLDDAEGPTTHLEIGWHLHPAHQGRGLVTEAARELLRRAAVAGITRVIAVTDPDNVASQAVTRRLGMVDEGLTDRWFGLTTRQFVWSTHDVPTEA